MAVRVCALYSTMSSAVFPLTVRPVPSAPHELGVFATRRVAPGESVWCEQSSASVRKDDLAAVAAKWPDFDADTMGNTHVAMCTMQKAVDARVCGFWMKRSKSGSKKYRK